jgi:glycosyltransferase involved in cell wall biosynthesis
MNNVNKLKIIFINGATTFSGSTRSLLNLIDGLENYGVKSYVACTPERELIKALKERNISFFTVPIKKWAAEPKLHNRIKLPIRLLVNLIVSLCIVWKIKKYNIDIDLIHSNSSLTPIGIFLSIILKKKHIWHIREYIKPDLGLCLDFGTKIFRYFLNKSDAIIYVSNALNKFHSKNIITKEFVIYNGIAFKNKMLKKYKEKYYQENNLYITRDYIFAIIGRLNYSKGQEDAIKALSHLNKKGYKKVRLLIVGEEEKMGYFKFLQNLSVELGVSNQVDFVGYVLDPTEYYCKSDAILVCSKWEAMGRVTAEAMAAARPIIGYSNGGTKELIDNYVNGLLYNGGYILLANEMEKFLKNPVWARAMGLNGFKKALKIFTIEKYAKSVFKVLKHIL